jgi:hypothetical protein
MTQGLCEGPEVGGGVVGQADGGGWVLRGGDQDRWGGGLQGPHLAQQLPQHRLRTGIERPWAVK